MNSEKIAQNELVTVCVVADDKDRQRAQPLCLQWIKAIHPLTEQTVEEMLPTKVSPTGAAPPTGWLCTLTLTQADAGHMQRFIVESSVPVKATIVGLQADTLESRTANREKWLADNGLKIVP
jgi:hypothetical protein